MRNRLSRPVAATRSIAASLPVGEGLALMVVLFLVLALG